MTEIEVDVAPIGPPAGERGFDAAFPALFRSVYRVV